MSRILKSLQGKHLGLNHQMELLAPKGLVSGNHGSQFHTPSPNKVVLFDDFVDNNLAAGLADTWLLNKGADAGTTPTMTLLATGVGGVLRLTTGDDGTLAADSAQITQHGLQWQAENGGLTFQTRIKLSRITTCWVYVGFTDVATAASLEAPIISASSANTITTNATDAVGFMFDTRMTDDKWWTVGVATNVDATHYNTTYAPVADDYATFRIEVSPTGVATFFYNGLQVGTAMSGALAAGTELTPIVAVSNTGGTATMTLDCDYVQVSMNRAADGGAV